VGEGAHEQLRVTEAVGQPLTESLERVLPAQLAVGQS
jgi:hypothetical protein